MENENKAMFNLNGKVGEIEMKNVKNLSGNPTVKIDGEVVDVDDKDGVVYVGENVGKIKVENVTSFSDKPVLIVGQNNSDNLNLYKAGVVSMFVFVIILIVYKIKS